MGVAVPAQAERRSPNRATNVARPKFKAKAAPGLARSTQLPVSETAARKTGTDDEWTSF